MTRRPLLSAAAALVFVGLQRDAHAAGQFLGDWFGALDLGSRRLRLRLVVEQGPRSTLYSIDQGNTPIPAGETRVEGNRIFITWPSIGARYEGELSGARIVGQFTQGGTLPLTFSRTQEDTATRVEPLTQAGLAKLRAQAGAPAFAAAASNRNGRRLAFVDGVRAMKQPALATTQDKWHIGSCTKSMTATLVARAVDAGSLTWGDTVGKVLGGAVAGIHPDYRDVTYRHLLSHRSGLAGNIELSELIKFPRESTDARADRIAYARMALTRPPNGPKEKHYEYSNSGFVIAGAMLEAQLGAPWEKLIHDRLFAPLKMTSAGFGAPGTPGAFDQPVGHALSPLGQLDPYPPGAPVTDNPAVLGPAGRVHIALDHLLSYLREHCMRSRFLSDASWRMLHTPPFGGGYAMGWERRDDTLAHGGSNTLWYCEMQADLKRGLVAAAATNDGRLDAVTIPVGTALAAALEAVAEGP